MAKSYIFLGVFLLNFLCLKGQTLPEGSTERTTVCAGTILRGRCLANKVIAVKDVKYGTKLTRKFSLCNTVSGCCDYDPKDCFEPPYTGTEQQAACSGRSSCRDVRIGPADPSACGDSYPGLTHYFTMEYYCIPDSRTGSLSSATLQETGKLLYIKNTDYPNPIRASETSISCSVETISCLSQIRVYFVHFELSDGDSCTSTQNLQIKNRGVTQTYTCSDNTNYSINLKLTSASNYLSLLLYNPDRTTGGRFFMGFQATESTAPLTVNCPAANQVRCMDCPALGNIPNGAVSTSDGLSTGKTANYSCEPEFDLLGNKTRTCLETGQWSGQEPTCLIKEACPGLSCPENGQVSTNGDTTGSQATYSCSSVFILSDNTSRVCQGNFTWSGSQPTCTKRELGDSCTMEADCSDAIPESICKNNICVCPEGSEDEGKKCVRPEESKPGGVDDVPLWGWILIGLGGVLIIVLIIVVSCYRCRRKNNHLIDDPDQCKMIYENTKNVEKDKTYAYDNDAYQGLKDKIELEAVNQKTEEQVSMIIEPPADKDSEAFIFGQNSKHVYKDDQKFNSIPNKLTEPAGEEQNELPKHEVGIQQDEDTEPLSERTDSLKDNIKHENLKEHSESTDESKHPKTACKDSVEATEEEIKDAVNLDDRFSEAGELIKDVTTALFRSASIAKKDLAAKASLAGFSFDTTEDGEWSKGLISAAKSVLAAIFSMCTIANEMVEGNASEEKMNAATKEVKRATNALVLSYHVEGYSESDSLQKLKTACGEVNKAAESLLTSASSKYNTESGPKSAKKKSIALDSSEVQKAMKRIEAQETVTWKQKELEELRRLNPLINEEQNRFETETTETTEL